MKVAFDTTLMRPGCAIVQAALGCDPAIANEFDPAKWLTYPSDDMGVYEITDEQLGVLSARINEGTGYDPGPRLQR